MAEKMALKVVTRKKVGGWSEGEGVTLGLFRPNTVEARDRLAGPQGALLETKLFLYWIAVQVTAHSN